MVTSTSSHHTRPSAAKWGLLIRHALGEAVVWNIVRVSIEHGTTCEQAEADHDPR